MAEGSIIQGEVIESRTEPVSWAEPDYRVGTDDTERELLVRILAAQEETNSILKDISQAVNSQSEGMNWLTENTSGLFTAIGQMNAAGGPMALLGMMKG